jgi:hypothetical protein
VAALRWYGDTNISEEYAATIFHPEDGDTIILRYIGTQLPHHMLSYKLRLDYELKKQSERRASFMGSSYNISVGFGILWPVGDHQINPPVFRYSSQKPLPYGLHDAATRTA